MSVQTLYEDNIKALPAAERLRLARMILDGIPPQAMVDYSGQWTDEDLADFAKSGWRQMEETEGESDHA